MKKDDRERPEGERSEDKNRDREAAIAAADKQVFLRSVYPMNSGIPHYVDVPGGW